MGNCLCCGIRSPVYSYHSPRRPHRGTPFWEVEDDASSTRGEEKKQFWINSVMKKINSEARPHKSESGSIFFKVPDHIKKNSPNAYEPQLVPIGPYHYHLRGSIEKERYQTILSHKWQCVRALLSRHNNETHARNQLEKCLRWLVRDDLQKFVRGCYSEDLNGFDVEELAQLLLADACFIIHLLLQPDEEMVEIVTDTTSKNQSNHGKRTFVEVSKLATFVRREETEMVEIVKDGIEETEMVVLNIKEIDKKIRSPFVGLGTRNLVLCDLLKVENQIPFSVLQKVYDLLKTTDDAEDLKDYVIRLFTSVWPELDWLQLLSNRLPKVGLQFVLNFKVHNFDHLLHIFYWLLVREMMIYGEESKKREEWNKEADRIPNASELRTAGVKIERYEHALNFLDIKYKKGIIDGLRASSLIQIPKFHIYDFTESLFRNLIAYEQCHNNIKPENYYITLFAVFMDCIIDNANDVRLLESKGILISRLGTQEAVADLFNNLGKNLHYKVRGSYLESLFTDVNNDCKSKYRRGFSTFKRSYCPHKFAFFSVLGAILLLSLTIVQVVYAVLSYYEPHY